MTTDLAPPSDRPFLQRIELETPRAALEALHWPISATEFGLFTVEAVDRTTQAQYRYEEGRAAVCEYGLRCKAWGRPDYPPAAIRKHIFDRVLELRGAAA
jgi:hypothetical protein